MKMSKPIRIIRAAVQIAVFIFLPALYVLTINQVKLAFQSILQHSFTLSTLASLLLVIGVLLVTALTGRFFCGWVCSFGAFTDLVYTLRRKLWKKNFRIGEKTDSRLKWLKYVILLLLFFPIWSLGLKSFSALSAWDSFGLLFSFGKAPALSAVLSNMAVSLLVLIAVTVLSAVFERFFCRYLCPLGALLSIASKFRIFKLSKPREQCGKCRACTSVCSMGIPLYKSDSVCGGECIQCMKCVSICPRNNVKLKAGEVGIGPLVTGVAAAATLAGVYYTGNFALNLQTTDMTATSSISSTAAGSTVDSLSSISTSNPSVSTDSIAVSLLPSQPSSPTASSAVSSANASLYKDGTYQGSGFGFRGQTTVSVTISGGKITDVSIVSYNDDPPYFNHASATICNEVVSNQSAQVNTVSGATYSSEGVISAVADALSRALK